MGERWYGNPEVSDLSAGPVKVFFAIFRNCSEVPSQFFFVLVDSSGRSTCISQSYKKREKDGTRTRAGQSSSNRQQRRDDVPAL